MGKTEVNWKEVVVKLLKLCALVLIVLGFISAPPLSAQAKPDKTIILEGHCDAKDARGSGHPSHLLPFDVPEGVTRIEIKKQLDFGPGKSGTVDHGLCDPRGAGFGMPGFRGWMGGSKADIFLTGDTATTSQYYLAGPIQPGRWTLLQWTVGLPDGGLDYKYTIRLSFDGPKPPDRMPEVAKCDQGVLNPKPGWYMGDLHCHTHHSDGNKTVSELVRQREDAGFDFLAVTDHNTALQHYDFAEAEKAHPKTLIIPGEEITHSKMHANVLGTRPGSFYDMRIDPTGLDEGYLSGDIAQTHRQGALFSVNHPFNWNPPDWRIPPDLWKDADAVEVWNAGWDGADQRAIEHWDALLQKGWHLTAVSGSDTHGGDAMQCVASHVYAESLSRDAIIEGIRKGHVFITETRKGPQVFLSVRGKSALPGDTVAWRPGDPLPVEVRVIGGEGLTLRVIRPGGETRLSVDKYMATFACDVSLDFSRPANYVRVELLKSDGRMAALTNPIYIREAR